MRRLSERWGRHVDARALGVARIAVGMAGIVKLLVIAPILFALSSAGAVRLPVIDDFTPALAAPVATVGVWAASALALALGIRARLAGMILCATATLTLATDWQLYSNHLYLLMLMAGLLAAADAGAALSVDARQRGGRPVLRVGPDLIRLQISIVYGFAALLKINPAFLSGWVLGTYVRGGFIELPEPLREPWILAGFAVLAVLIELTLPFGLWSRRFRVPAAIVGAGLHIAFVLLLAPWVELIVFGLLMVGTYPLFLWRDREEVRDRPAAPAPVGQSAPMRSSSRTNRG